MLRAGSLLSKFLYFCSIFCTGLLAPLPGAVAAETDTAPDFSHCPQQKQWRAAIFQFGCTVDYLEDLISILSELQQEGLTLKNNPPKLNSSFVLHSSEQFETLSRDTRTDCLHFVPDGFYCARWNENKLQTDGKALLTRARNGDIDLILAFGTPAGLFLKQRELNVPSLVIEARSPETTGLSFQGEFSGVKNFHVTKEPNTYRSELNMFYDIFRFKRLGVVMDKDPLNQVAQGRPFIEQIASERNFKLDYCFTDVFTTNTQNAQENFKSCLIQLAQSADAVYLTEHLGIDQEHYHRQLQPLIEAGLPTLDQSGAIAVARGALLATDSLDSSALGHFEADVIKRVMHGEAPENIGQICHVPKLLFLNIKTARAIGWRPPFDVISSADVIYHNFNDVHQRRTSIRPLKRD